MAASVPLHAPIPDDRYARPPTAEQLDRTVENLRAHGFEVVLVANAAEARRAALAHIPPGSEVFDFTSQTLETTGIASALADVPGVSLLRPRLRAMDRTAQAREIRRLSQTPEVAIGSVHAVTEDGQLLVASATGSQLGPYAYGAGRVIWVVGWQKIVPTLEEGIRRIERHSLPLEDARARRVYGVGSSINRILIFRRENPPGRSTLILVRESLGF